jgi:mono/diheme cytochrome c family protein
MRKEPMLYRRNRRTCGGLVTWVTIVSLGALGCSGGDEGASQGQPGGGESTPQASDLTAEEIENGIGPIRSVELNPVDEAKADQGEEIFQLKCSACHKLDERYVGPPLREVLDRRSPEFVMNMILNSWEMTQKHPAVRELLAEYYTPMPDQNLTEEEAYAVLEYLRHEHAEEAEDPS